VEIKKEKITTNKIIKLVVQQPIGRLFAEKRNSAVKRNHAMHNKRELFATNRDVCFGITPRAVQKAYSLIHAPPH
jgi:hypothetical protein